MDELQLIIQVVTKLLSDSSSEPSARLKQRINATLKMQGYLGLDEKKFGCRKFSDFLKGPLGDHVRLEWPEGSGDVWVTLRHDSAILRQKPAIRESRTKVDRSTALRSDVWQAFTNPDSTRKRFYNRLTNQVVHFVADAGESYQKLVESKPTDFLEIAQIPADVHRTWMREFLELAGVSAGELVPLQALLDSTYSSDVNAAFTKALGDRELQWRQMRTLKISEKIQAWAVEHNINPDSLSNQPAVVGALDSTRPAKPKVDILSPRQQAIRLLELMSDEEILISAIPVLLDSVLSKSKF